MSLYDHFCKQILNSLSQEVLIVVIIMYFSLRTLWEMRFSNWFNIRF